MFFLLNKKIIKLCQKVQSFYFHSLKAARKNPWACLSMVFIIEYMTNSKTPSNQWLSFKISEFHLLMYLTSSILQTTRTGL